MDKYKTTIIGANILEVAAGTTGYCGGDSGHGGRTYFSIRDIGGTDIVVNVDKDHRGFDVKLGGDSELDTIIDALEFIAFALKEEIKKQEEKENA